MQREFGGNDMFPVQAFSQGFAERSSQKADLEQGNLP